METANYVKINTTTRALIFGVIALVLFALVENYGERENLRKRIEALESAKRVQINVSRAAVYGDAMNVVLTDKTNIYVYDGGIFHELTFKPLR